MFGISLSRNRFTGYFRLWIGTGLDVQDILDSDSESKNVEPGTSVKECTKFKNLKSNVDVQWVFIINIYAEMGKIPYSSRPESSSSNIC